MYDVRITAIRKADYRDLQVLYENPIEHACDVLEGQSWVSHGGARPDGLCLSAWDSMHWFVQELAAGRGNFYDGWMRNPNSALISCNDGFRPVSFLLERIDNTQQA
ncbi:MAG: TIGR04076 family protein [Bacteroidales bacterium]|nr:TIGR04076 family protein [Bacteroidales bacterium]